MSESEDYEPETQKAILLRSPYILRGKARGGASLEEVEAESEEEESEEAEATEEVSTEEVTTREVITKTATTDEIAIEVVATEEAVSMATGVTLDAKMLEDFMRACTKKITGEDASEGSSDSRGMEKFMKRLPSMGDRDKVEDFIRSLEAAFHRVNAPKRMWKELLLTKLTQAQRTKVADLEVMGDSKYEDITERLILVSGHSPTQAADRFFAVGAEERSCSDIETIITSTKMALRKILDGEMISPAATEKLVVARFRHLVSPQAREFLLTRDINNEAQLRVALSNWGSLKGSLSSLYGAKSSEPRKKGACFHCGKLGHYAGSCPTKNEKKEEQQQPHPARKPLTCYTCGVQGHKAADCSASIKPEHKNYNKLKMTKRVSITGPKLTKKLKPTELFVTMNGYRFPATLDTGSGVSIVPKEFVPETMLTGRRVAASSASGHDMGLKEAKVELDVGGVKLSCGVGVKDGETLGWVGIVSLDRETAESKALHDKLFAIRDLMSDDDITYTGPFQRIVYVDSLDGKNKFVDDRICNSVNQSEKCQVSGKEVGVDESNECLNNVNVDDSQSGEVEETCRGEEESEGLHFVHLVEAWVPTVEVSKNEQSCSDPPVSSPTPESDLRVCKVIAPDVAPVSERLKELCKTDQSLQQWRELADKGLKGYSWRDGVLTRDRIDDLGQVISQICVPQELRQKVLVTAHDKCGHPGKAKVAMAVKKSFIWPGMWRDIARFCRSCPECQLISKARPRKAPMVVREVVSVPFESVCVDLVGPLPKAKGGAEFILTYVDQATRWPEAVPMTKITSSAVIRALLGFFGRNGFPLKILTDNGKQFVSSEFRGFCEKYGISHSLASPYHPQSNGLVERMHGTLSPMLTKLCEGHRGRWPDLLQQCMYFIRILPCEATGYSPYEAVHGFLPVGPVQLLRNGWMANELRDLDLDEWIEGNMERVECMREKMCLRQDEIGKEREKKWNKGARLRVFEVGDQVLLRLPGMDSKLTESWEGPFKVIGKCSEVSYKLDVGRSKPRLAHVNSLKTWVDRENRVGRVTSIVEGESDSDCLEERVSGVVVRDVVEDACKQRDIEAWCREFDDVLSEEPGLVKGLEFEIDTGDTPPIAQGPYNTPLAVRDKVDKELDWLLEKGIIRPSQSPWSSPMVTAPKPDGRVRICVDFKKINMVTSPVTFYMPGVNELIEEVGDAKFISTVDLTKGYYQVPMEPSSIPKTAFLCHRGRFEFLRMPFGVRNAPALFQSVMTRLLHPVRSLASCYIDDIVIHSRTWEEHVEDVKIVLEIVRKAGLKVNPRKCVWGGRKVEFLGMEIGEGKCRIPEHRCKAIRDFVRPKTRKGLRSFIGLVSYYRRFMKRLASQTAILTPAISKSAPPVVVWTAAMVSAFNVIRDMLCGVDCLYVPLPSDKVSIVSDASGLGVGGALQVWRDDTWLPAAYYSRQTRGPERRYAASDLEALALIETVKHFSHYLYGKTFTAFTDHKALCALTSSTKLTGRLQRYALKLQPWLIDIVHVPGVTNGLADALSRQEWGERSTTTTGRVKTSSSEEDRSLVVGGVRDTPSLMKTEEQERDGDNGRRGKDETGKGRHGHKPEDKD